MFDLFEENGIQLCTGGPDPLQGIQNFATYRDFLPGRALQDFGTDFVSHLSQPAQELGQGCGD
ncbi:hypothetical protein [Streptomyces canus]|uniref:hypothetical protein n=1 Tax=Streptomyces canus TaxID=58343 RepID=UPI00224E1FAE|nr:hypothetical protein [Streptomyces canus]MCX4862365.1 hypothetical protein [Streptomyces canus]